jgi:Gpi18-like mannosyltransferase
MQRLYNWYKVNGLLKLVVFILFMHLIMTACGFIAVSRVGTFDNDWNIQKSNSTNQTSSSVLDMWSRWDGQWYKSIADNGYQSKGQPYSIGTNRDIVFFPLFPLASRIFSFGVLPPVLVGLLISNLASIAIVGLLYAYLLQRKVSKKIAKLSVWLLFAHPMAFIFGAYYTEALFLLCVLATLYSWQKQQKILTFVFGVLAGLTRPVGVVVSVVGAIQLIQQKFWTQPVKTWLPKAASLSGPLIGYGLFAFYAKLRTGSWSAFTIAETEGWGRTAQLSSIFKNLFIQPFVGPNWFVFAACAWIAIVLVLWQRRKIGLDLTVWTLLTLALPLSTSILGMPRYTVVLFSIPLAASFALIRYPKLIKPLLIVLFMLQIVGFCLWTMNAQFMV